jgi:hypothetical protein
MQTHSLGTLPYLQLSLAFDFGLQTIFYLPLILDFASTTVLESLYSLHLYHGSLPFTLPPTTPFSHSLFLSCFICSAGPTVIVYRLSYQKK